eukprot:gene25995-31390_t
MDEVQRILLRKHDEASLFRAVQALRLEADGCRLQGGEDQVDKAMRMYCAVDTILLREELSMYRSEDWYKRERRQCQLGRGLALADVQNYEEAEDILLEVILTTDHGGMEHAAELLGAAASLVGHVYFEAADQLPQDTRALAEGSWLHRAWHVLRWSLSSVCSAEAAPQGGNLLDLHSSLSDQAVQSLYSTLCSPAFLQSFATADGEAAEEWCKQVQEALGLLHQVLKRLGRHALAAQMCSTLLDSFSGREQPVFQVIRLGCVQCMVSYCESLCATRSRGLKVPSAVLSDWLHRVEQQLAKVDSRGRSAAELWGDWFRMRGDLGSLCAALCLYAACFAVAGACGLNEDGRRVAQKVQVLAAHTPGSNFRLASTVTNSCMEILHSAEIIVRGANLVVNQAKLDNVVNESKTYLVEWTAMKEERDRLIARVDHTIKAKQSTSPLPVDPAESSLPAKMPSASLGDVLPSVTDLPTVLMSNDECVHKDTLVALLQKVAKELDEEDVQTFAAASTEQNLSLLIGDRETMSSSQCARVTERLKSNMLQDCKTRQECTARVVNAIKDALPLAHTSTSSPAVPALAYRKEKPSSKSPIAYPPGIEPNDDSILQKAIADLTATIEQRRQEINAIRRIKPGAFLKTKGLLRKDRLIAWLEKQAKTLDDEDAKVFADDIASVAGESAGIQYQVREMVLHYCELKQQRTARLVRAVKEACDAMEEEEEASPKPESFADSVLSNKDFLQRKDTFLSWLQMKEKELDEEAVQRLAEGVASLQQVNPSYKPKVDLKTSANNPSKSYKRLAAAVRSEFLLIMAS